jgi:hypothetical protein
VAKRAATVLRIGDAFRCTAFRCKFGPPTGFEETQVTECATRKSRKSGGFRRYVLGLSRSPIRHASATWCGNNPESLGRNYQRQFRSTHEWDARSQGRVTLTKPPFRRPMDELKAALCSALSNWHQPAFEAPTANGFDGNFGASISDCCIKRQRDKWRFAYDTDAVV